MSRKTDLTFEEHITAAFMHYVREIEQQDVAMMYGVNMGRVNEACMLIRKALEGAGVRRGWDRMNIEDLPLRRKNHDPGTA